MQTIISKARAAGLHVGAGLPDDPEIIAEMIKRGVQWMSIGGDAGYLWQHFDRVAAAARAITSRTSAPHRREHGHRNSG